jgi:hypothetical protein
MGKKAFLLLLPVLALGLSACSLKGGLSDSSGDSTVQSATGSSVTSWVNSLASTTVTASIPNATYSGKTCSFTDANLVAGNIKSSTSIFGVTGTYVGNFQSAMGSMALRDAGVQVISNLSGQTTSFQLSLDNEQNLYTAADLPTTGGYNYRDVPDATKDSDNFQGVTCKYATRPSVNCGTTQTTIAARIADCAAQNPSSSTWNGATQCNRGQAIWKLVTRSAANKEVWQDQRTGQIWSSVVSQTANWCQASGNTQQAPVTFINSFNNAAGTPITGDGTIGSISGGTSSQAETITVTMTGATTFTVTGTAAGAGCQGGAITAGGLTGAAGSTVTWSRANYCSFVLTQGAINFANNDKFTLQSVDAANYSCAAGAASGLQPASPISFCAEVAGVNAPAGETWGTGSYMTAKGGMGKTATGTSPSIRWRLPSTEDQRQAEIDGMTMVMPDTGLPGSSRPTPDTSAGGLANEWSSTLSSNFRQNAWEFDPDVGGFSRTGRNTAQGARCVGR